VVTDETTVAMDWLLGNAIGWIKVQVLEEDAERAVATLEGSLGGDTEPVDEEELAAEAEAAPAEDPIDAGQQHEAPVDPIAEAAARENEAGTALAAAILGIVIPIATLYAIVLILQASSGPGKLSRGGKFQLAAAIVFVFIPIILTLLILSLLLENP
jgi:hypothetical protein